MGTLKKHSRTQATNFSRRQILGRLAVAGATLLAGCGALGESGPRPNPGEPPETNFRFNQNKGVKRGTDATVTVEIIHDGGDRIDPETLSITIDDEQLEEREYWVWDEAGGTRDFDSINGMMTEEDMIAIRGKDVGTGRGRKKDISGDEIVRLVWTSPEDGEEIILASYEVKECLGRTTPNEDDSCPS